MNAFPIARTANVALARSIYQSAQEAPYSPEPARHGTITTANASLFVQAHYSAALSTYAIGFQDPSDVARVSEFLAPSIDGNGERFEYQTYPNAEAFLSDDADDDLRAIHADFKTVDFTSDKVVRTVPNRGLRMVVDYDRVKTEQNWDLHRTALLLKRIKRNAWRRKYALALAASTTVPIIWDGAGGSDPDFDLANQAEISADVSGVRPNRALWGANAALLRYQCLGATNAAKSRGRNVSAEMASGALGMEAMVDQSRFQNGVTKSRIVGSTILLFSGLTQSGQDPSNFKTAWADTQQGGRYGVYLRQLTVKQWELVVECYETEWCASTLGCQLLTITPS